ncbi:MAG: hypothetical protein Wins2KO_20770 [Winogradskyella sp.]
MIGPMKFPNGMKNLEKVDKCINVAKFLVCLSIIFKKYIIVSYANICLKEGSMLRIVPNINIFLTLVRVK